MKLLILVFSLTLSANAWPTHSTNITTRLQDALKAASDSLNDTLKYITDATRTSSTGMNVTMIVNQFSIALAPVFANFSRTIDANKLDLPSGQAYANSILDILISESNQLVVQIQEQRVFDQFIQKTMTTYQKVCEILLPFLEQSNNQVLADTWVTITGIQISTFNALEFVKAQTYYWQNAIKFSNETDTVKPKFKILFDKVYADLFNNTLTTQSKNKFVDEYKQLNSEVVRIFGDEFKKAENTVYTWAADYWYYVYNHITQVRNVFQQVFEVALTQVKTFGYTH